MPEFNYSAFFRRIQDLKQLQIRAEDVSWVEKHHTPDRAYETVLYLGCNILRTPHIAKQVIDVFTHLGIDFIPVGGVQFCCGIVWDKFDGPKKGSQVSDRTVGRLESYQPKRVVMWCPSCNVHFKDVIIGRDSRQPQFEITHTTQFLAEMAQRGEIAWDRAVSGKVALHTHVGRTGMKRDSGGPSGTGRPRPPSWARFLVLNCSTNFSPHRSWTTTAVRPACVCRHNAFRLFGLTWSARSRVRARRTPWQPSHTPVIASGATSATLVLPSAITSPSLPKPWGLKPSTISSAISRRPPIWKTSWIVRVTPGSRTASAGSRPETWRPSTSRTAPWPRRPRDTEQVW